MTSPHISEFNPPGLYILQNPFCPGFWQALWVGSRRPCCSLPRTICQWWSYCPLKPLAFFPFVLDPSSLWVTASGVGSWARPCLCLSYPSWSSLLSCCGGSVPLVLKFSEEFYSICSCEFVVLVGGGEFSVFLCRRLETLQPNPPSILCWKCIMETFARRCSFRICQ